MNKIVLLFIMFVSVSFGQMLNQSASQSILKGKVTDQDGNPLALEINIAPQQGARFIIKTNPSTGAYEQLLNAEQTYKFAFIHPEVLRKDFDVTVPKPDEDFNPVIKDFVAQKLSKGSVIMTGDIFEEGSEKLNSNLDKFIKDLNKMMRFNRSISIEFQLSGDNGLDAKRLAVIQEASTKWKRLNRKTNYIAGGKNPDDKDVTIKVKSIDSK